MFARRERFNVAQAATVEIPRAGGMGGVQPSCGRNDTQEPDYHGFSAFETGIQVALRGLRVPCAGIPYAVCKTSPALRVMRRR